MITAIRDYGDAVRKEVLAQGLRRLRKGSDSEEVLEYAVASLMKKLLHYPSVRLREAGEEADKDFVAAAAELFGLNDKQE